jgi:hypothetical protein
VLQEVRSAEVVIAGALPCHLAVPGSRVMWLDEPQACPVYPGITLDGLAVAPDGQRHYLVLTVRPRSKPPFHLHIGPDQAALARTGLILVAALRTYGGDLSTAEAGVAVLAWISDCWTETAAELDATTSPASDGSGQP